MKLKNVYEIIILLAFRISDLEKEVKKIKDELRRGI